MFSLPLNRDDFLQETAFLLPIQADQARFTFTSLAIFLFLCVSAFLKSISRVPFVKFPALGRPITSLRVRRELEWIMAYCEMAIPPDPGLLVWHLQLAPPNYVV